MMKSRYGILLVGIVGLASLAWADTLELKNGSVIKGIYVGGTEKHVSIRVGSTVQQYLVGDIVSLTFENLDAPAPQAEPAPAPTQPAGGFAQRPNPSPADQEMQPTGATTTSSVSIPTGTRLLVRTIDPIDSEKNRIGDKFQATLDQALVVGDGVVAPKGTTVYGRLEQVKQSGQFAGKSELRLALTGIVLQGRTYALSTGDYELSGKSRGADTAKKTIGGAAVGAVIGAIAGGGKGAAVGAGVGAGVGTGVQVMTHGDHVRIPSETLLEFTLDQQVSLPVSQGSRN
ncbi:MAG TPA: hypothetical protein VEW69_00685 [Alphaproteobacteria bacterium]|nr:hypothetical protein [Alphaproteobacteria bacterium]